MQERFRAEAEAAGAEVTLVVYPGQGHGFFNRGHGDKGRYRETLDQMLDFLADQDWVRPRR